MIPFNNNYHYDNIFAHIELSWHLRDISQHVYTNQLLQTDMVWDYYEGAARNEIMLNTLQQHLLYVNKCAPRLYWRAVKADNFMVVNRKWLVHALISLKVSEELGYSYLDDIYAIDFMGCRRFGAGELYHTNIGDMRARMHDSYPRYAVSYRFFNNTLNKSIMLIVFTQQLLALPSAREVFFSANFPEREAWEMVGVYFTAGTIDLQRLLSEYDFKWHPLRKDFPVTGYVECFYSYERKGIEFVKVEFMQEVRHYEFLNIWEHVEGCSFDRDEEDESPVYEDNVDAWNKYSLNREVDVYHPWVQDWGDAYIQSAAGDAGSDDLTGAAASDGESAITGEVEDSNGGEIEGPNELPVESESTNNDDSTASDSDPSPERAFRRKIIWPEGSLVDPDFSELVELSSDSSSDGTLSDSSSDSASSSSEELETGRSLLAARKKKVTKEPTTSSEEERSNEDDELEESSSGDSSDEATLNSDESSLNEDVSDAESSLSQDSGSDSEDLSSSEKEKSAADSSGQDDELSSSEGVSDDEVTFSEVEESSAISEEESCESEVSTSEEIPAPRRRGRPKGSGKAKALIERSAPFLTTASLLEPVEIKLKKIFSSRGLVDENMAILRSAGPDRIRSESAEDSGSEDDDSVLTGSLNGKVLFGIGLSKYFQQKAIKARTRKEKKAALDEIHDTAEVYGGCLSVDQQNRIYKLDERSVSLAEAIVSYDITLEEAAEIWEALYTYYKTLEPAYTRALAIRLFSSLNEGEAPDSARSKRNLFELPGWLTDTHVWARILKRQCSLDGLTNEKIREAILKEAQDVLQRVLTSEQQSRIFRLEEYGGIFEEAWLNNKIDAKEGAEIWFSLFEYYGAYSYERSSLICLAFESLEKANLALSAPVGGFNGDDLDGSARGAVFRVAKKNSEIGAAAIKKPRKRPLPRTILVKEQKKFLTRVKKVLGEKNRNKFLKLALIMDKAIERYEARGEEYPKERLDALCNKYLTEVMKVKEFSRGVDLLAAKPGAEKVVPEMCVNLEMVKEAAKIVMEQYDARLAAVVAANNKLSEAQKVSFNDDEALRTDEVKGAPQSEEDKALVP